MKLKPTKYTQVLTVRPQEVQNKYLLPKPKSYTQNKVMGGDDASSSEDEEEEERKQSKRKRKPLKPELLLSVPSAAGESMPVLKTAEAVRIKAIDKKAKIKAYRSFSLVEGLPAPPKESPFLKVLESAGLKNCKEVQSALNKLYKDEHADLRQDANCVLHVLNDCLDMVDAINTKREYAEEELERIQRDVYLVAMLQSQKLIVHGEAVMEQMCKHMKLPSIGELKQYTGLSDELTQEQQKNIIAQLKTMVELNKVIKDNPKNGSASDKDEPERPTVQRSDSAPSESNQTPPRQARSSALHSETSASTTSG